jgi:hypothetical protein
MSITKEQGDALIKYIEEEAAFLRTERLVGDSAELAVAIKNAAACRDEALAAFRALLP